MTVTQSRTTEGKDARPLPGHLVSLGTDRPLRLDCGAELYEFPVAYQTFVALNRDKSNAVLICHALTGDQFVAEAHPVTGKPGWWDLMVGPGKTLDSERYFIICANIVGGCMGTAAKTRSGKAAAH